MRLQPRSPPPDPIAAAVSSLLDDFADGLTATGRELLAWTEGVLTAAAIGPEPTRPDEWMQAVFGRGQTFDDAAEAQAAMTLLGLLYNETLRDIRRGGRRYTPRFLELAEDGEEIGLAREWAGGFIAGAALRWDAWKALVQSKQGGSLIAPIGVFLTRSDGVTPFPDVSVDEIDKVRRDALAWLGPAVFEISRYWKDPAGRLAPMPVDPFRKVGRNEPCPCGSGKKHKKCCLDRLD